MEIGRRIRELRTARKLSQGDVRKRTGLLKAYTSRVELGLVVPSVRNLARYAEAFEIPLYRIFYDPVGTDEKPTLPRMKAQSSFGVTEEERAEIEAFEAAWSKMDERDRRLLVVIAETLAGRSVLPRK